MNHFPTDFRGVLACDPLQHRRTHPHESFGDETASFIDNLYRVAYGELALDCSHADGEKRAASIA